MSFKINSLYLTDGYKVGHKAMLAPGTTKLYATWIPRSTKHAPKGVEKIVSFGQQMVWRWLHDEFVNNFFARSKEEALLFNKDMSLYLGMEYDGKHFEELWELGYLPIKVKALPEGIETDPNIPHMTFINTVDEFAWLTLYLETVVSSLAWKASTSATIAKLYRKQAEEWVTKTDPVTDDGTKKSLKGLLRVDYVNAYDDYKEIKVFTEQTPLQESTGLLQVIYEDGKFYNQTSLSNIRRLLLNN